METPVPQEFEGRVLENKETHPAYMQSIQHTIYILGAIVAVSIIGYVVVSGLGRAAGDNLLLLAATCVGGLVTFLAGPSRS